MRFERLSHDDGLSQDAALALLQDRTGYMWIGTEDGLNRYDGYQFKVFTQDNDDPGALASDFINDLAEDQHGHIWIATDNGGVSRWDPSTERFTTYRADPDDPASIVHDQVSMVQVSPRGEIWLGSLDTGLSILDPSDGTARQLAPLTERRIYVADFDSVGNAWVGTDDGLYWLDTDAAVVRHFSHDPDSPTGLPGKQVRALLRDRNGELWMGTDQGAARLDLATGVFQRFTADPADAFSLPNNRVKVIHQSQDGRLWFGTEGGLALLIDADRGRFVAFQNDPANPSSLSDNQVISLVSDRSGMLWVGTRLRGVNRWNPRSWSFGHNPASPAIGFGGSFTSSFAEDQQGRIWVSSNGDGIGVLNPTTQQVERWHTQHRTNRISDDRVMTMLADRRGVIWAGTMRGGLNRIDPISGDVQLFQQDASEPGSLSSNAVMSLFEDSAGVVWVGTFGGGLNRLNASSGTFELFQPDPANPNSLSDGRISAFAEGADGTLWVGTIGGGLNAFDPDSGDFRSYQHDPGDPQSLSSNTVYSLYLDAEQQLWVGTRSGLNRKLDDKFEVLTVRDGLANDTIFGIEQDTSGALWLSSNRGLTRYRPRSGEMTNFNRSHGLQGDEFNFGASHRTRSGELLFGGPNGFNQFRPGQLEFNRTPPPVVLTSVQKFNRPVDVGVPYDQLESLDLGYQDDVITFEFAALDYAAPERNEFRYKLDGFDENWQELGNRRRVTYTNLDGGDYTFRVQAANSDRIWNEAGLAIPMRMEPAPWATWWAYALYAAAGLALLSGLWFGQRARLAREITFRQRLQKEVRQRTAELGERNQDLQAANEKLEQASFTDPLTGLSNRRYLAATIDADVNQALRNHYQSGDDEIAKGLAFIMVDLDHFKPINDSFGHAAGDQVLLGVRDVLRNACRSSDVIVRWGGDEFMVVARETDPEQTRALAERIRSQISHKIFGVGDGQVARTSTSIGFASFPFLPDAPEEVTWEEVTRLADLALYEAKASRNAWVGYAATGSTHEIGNLFQAIKENPQELVDAGQLELHSSRLSQARTA